MGIEIDRELQLVMRDAAQRKAERVTHVAWVPKEEKMGTTVGESTLDDNAFPLLLNRIDRLFIALMLNRIAERIGVVLSGDLLRCYTCRYEGDVGDRFPKRP